MGVENSLVKLLPPHVKSIKLAVDVLMGYLALEIGDGNEKDCAYECGSAVIILCYRA